MLKKWPMAISSIMFIIEQCSIRVNILCIPQYSKRQMQSLIHFVPSRAEKPDKPFLVTAWEFSYNNIRKKS